MSKARQKQRATAPVADKTEARAFRRAFTHLNSHRGLLRQIEASIPACLVLGVVRAIAGDERSSWEDKRFSQQLVDRLWAASAEPFDGLPRDEATKAISAAYSIAVYAYDVPDQGRAYGSLFMAAVIWLSRILDTGYLELTEGSSFALAAQDLLEDLDRARQAPENTERFAKLEKAADKLATKMQARLESLGLFVGASQPVGVAA